MAWSSTLRMICVGVISGFVASHASRMGFLLLDCLMLS